MSHGPIRRRRLAAVCAGIAEFECERTGAGRVSAKARGVRFGRLPKLTADQIALAQRLIAEGTSVPEVLTDSQGPSRYTL
jgi:hypothetical protein